MDTTQALLMINQQILWITVLVVYISLVAFATIKFIQIMPGYLVRAAKVLIIPFKKEPTEEEEEIIRPRKLHLSNGEMEMAIRIVENRRKEARGERSVREWGPKS